MISKDNAEHYTWGGDCDGWHLLKSPTLSVIHERMPPGRAEARHHHAKAQQLFFVLSGILTMHFDGCSETIGAGEAIEIRPGVAHRAANDSTDAVEFLVISEPPTLGDRVESA